MIVDPHGLLPAEGEPAVATRHHHLEVTEFARLLREPDGNLVVQDRNGRASHARSSTTSAPDIPDWCPNPSIRRGNRRIGIRRDRNGLGELAPGGPDRRELR